MIEAPQFDRMAHKNVERKLGLLGTPAGLLGEGCSTWKTARESIRNIVGNRTGGVYLIRKGGDSSRKAAKRGQNRCRMDLATESVCNELKEIRNRLGMASLLTHHHHHQVQKGTV